jgi:hypothetical protein
VTSPVSAAGAADPDALGSGAVDSGAVLGAVLVDGLEQALAMIAMPATIDASRSCVLIVCSVSSLLTPGRRPRP